VEVYGGILPNVAQMSADFFYLLDCTAVHVSICNVYAAGARSHWTAYRCLMSMFLTIDENYLYSKIMFVDLNLVYY